MRWLNRGRSVAVSAQHHPIRTNLGGRERSREGGREGGREGRRREGGREEREEGEWERKEEEKQVHKGCDASQQ